MEVTNLHEIIRYLKEENKRLNEMVNDLRAQLGMVEVQTSEVPRQLAISLSEPEDSNEYPVNRNSSKEEKIELFMSLFKGREDVCAKRWRGKPGYSPYCFNDFKEGICHKPKVKCIDCQNSRFAPLDKERIEGHLMGKYVLGLYPMTRNDSCYLLAMDFDESTWKEEVRAVVSVCRRLGIPAYPERSRSGNGCHIWFFLEEEMKSSMVRKLGMSILSQAMKECTNIRFTSFDRLFPSQDFLQKDGFGNLIALPLQKESREQGNSIFVTDDFEAIEDQWSYLSKIRLITKEDIFRVITDLQEMIDEPDEGIKNRRVSVPNLRKEDFPSMLRVEKTRGLSISKRGLSPRALYYLRGSASYPNPEFFAKQAMRQTTYGIPRMSSVYEEDDQRIILPRGTEKSLLDVLNKIDMTYDLIDSRVEGERYPMTFCGTLTDHQEEAFKALSSYEDGVLSAATGFGKTVVGARLIAEKSCATLILVHTRELANQWKERLEQFLKIDISLDELKGKGRRKKSVVGMLGGGKDTLHGVVDIAIMQSMYETDKSIKPLIHDYGLILVDECHHVSARNFMRILSECDAKHVYGLTATPVRKDGHHPAIFMHCGPIRYTVDAKEEAKNRDFDHYILPRFTSLRMPYLEKNKDRHITEIYRLLCESEARNSLILKDVAAALEEGRSPLILTERTDHVTELSNGLETLGIRHIVLTGKLKSRERREASERIAELKNDERMVILATGRLVGEGFDLPRLDTLFLAMPIAWKGTIAQYAGRLHRQFQGKEEVLIYDYVDVHIPVLERMYQKRLSAYKAVGYSLRSFKDLDKDSGIYDEKNYFLPMIEDIRCAKVSILLSSTFITRKKIDEITGLLMEKYHSGVQITLIIKPLEEFSDKHRRNMMNILTKLENQGVEIIYRQENHLKFMMVDGKVIWYGGMDLLSDKYGEDSIIRVKDEVLASEMIGVLLRS